MRRLIRAFRAHNPPVIMDKLKQLESFVSVATRGSLTAAAKTEGVAPAVPKGRDLHSDVTISLNQSDRVVDLAGEGYDCAVRVGDLADSSLISVRLADNRRLCVATPAYLKRHGTPKHPNDLVKFDCLALSSEASQTRGWMFRVPKAGGDGFHYLKPTGPLDCSDGQVLHDWCLEGRGIAWRSTW